jgi:DNA-binding phage protein
MSKAKRIRGADTPEERERYKQVLAEVERDKPEILARGRELKRGRDELLKEVMSLLNEAKQAGDLSLAELQRRTGIERATLSRLLSDSSSNPTLSTLNRLAAAFGKRLVVTLEDK